MSFKQSFLDTWNNLSNGKFKDNAPAKAITAALMRVFTNDIANKVVFKDEFIAQPKVVAKSANYSMSTGDNGVPFSNEGAGSDSINFTLPDTGDPTSEGSQFEAIINKVDTGIVTITPPAGEIIHNLQAGQAIQCQYGLYAQDSQASIRLRKVSSDKWNIIGGTGTWFFGDKVLVSFGTIFQKFYEKSGHSGQTSIGILSLGQDHNPVRRGFCQVNGDTRIINDLDLQGQKGEIVFKNTSSSPVTIELPGAKAKGVPGEFILEANEFAFISAYQVDATQKLWTHLSQSGGSGIGEWAQKTYSDINKIVFTESAVYNTEGAPNSDASIIIDTNGGLRGAQIKMHFQGTEEPVFTGATINDINPEVSFEPNTLMSYWFLYDKDSNVVDMIKKLKNSAPYANNADLNGIKEVGQTISVQYNFFDEDGDLENTTDGPLVSFERSGDDGSGAPDGNGIVTIQAFSQNNSFALSANEEDTIVRGVIQVLAQSGAKNGQLRYTPWFQITAAVGGAGQVYQEAETPGSYTIILDTGTKGSIGAQTLDIASGGSVLRMYDSNDNVRWDLTMPSNQNPVTFQARIRTGSPGDQQGYITNGYFALFINGQSYTATLVPGSLQDSQNLGGITLGTIEVTGLDLSAGPLTVQFIAVGDWFFVDWLKFNW